MKLLHRNGFTPTDREVSRIGIIEIVLRSLLAMTDGMEQCGLDFDNPNTREKAADLKKVISNGRYCPANQNLLDVNASIICEEIWEDVAVQAFYRDRDKYGFRTEEWAHFFLARINEVCDPGYSPSDQDIIKARVTTTGIVEEHFEITSTLRMMMIDVGGQRSQRHKWIKCFDELDAVIFVTDLTGYDKVRFKSPDHHLKGQP